ncbi:MAG: carboxypeptidase regulatory-like domain-containing protein, partial [Verrucomicrobiota bacterium]
MSTCPAPALVRLRLLVSALAALWAGAGAAQAQTVEGRVFNAATGLALAKARVTVEGTNVGVLTDETGRFRLTGLAAGEARLGVAFIGFDRQTATVAVPVPGAAQRDFELQVS